MKLNWKISEIKMVAGILDGSEAFTGPLSVQIDLTNKCNNNCIGCWCNSPLLGDKAMDPETKKKELPFELIKKLIDELDEMCVREVYLTGGGEPFMHPKIMDIIEYIKSKGMGCDMSTNFTLINKERAEKLVGLGIDHMNISMWAGTAEIYVKTHPNKKEDDFYRMRDMLIYLGKLKKKERKKKPIINIYNVISNLNYDEIKEMIDFAFLVRADSVDFTMMDPVEGRTEILLLNEEQRYELIKEISKVREYVNKKNAEFGVELKVNSLEQFLRRVSNENSKEGNYDSNIVDTIPCYAGWTFARVMANGNILSCLKSHLMPIGNIYKQSFKKAWYSKKQRLFREKSKCKKSDSYFSKINCYKSCDNLGTNLSIHGKIQSLPVFSKFLLRNLVSILKPKGKKL